MTIASIRHYSSNCLISEIHFVHFRESVIVLPSSWYYLELHVVSPSANSVEFEFPGTDFMVTPYNFQGWYIHFTC